MATKWTERMDSPNREDINTDLLGVYIALEKLTDIIHKDADRIVLVPKRGILIFKGEEIISASIVKRSIYEGVKDHFVWWDRAPDWEEVIPVVVGTRELRRKGAR